MEHTCRDEFERYAIRTLPGAELGHLEEELICSDCWDRLVQTNGYLAAVRAAGAERFREAKRAVSRSPRIESV